MAFRQCTLALAEAQGFSIMFVYLRGKTLWEVHIAEMELFIAEWKGATGLVWKVIMAAMVF